jgi:hypothetical protein
MSSDKQKFLVGEEKPGRRLEDDQIEHLWGWTMSPTKAN